MKRSYPDRLSCGFGFIPFGAPSTSEAINEDTPPAKVQKTQQPEKHEYIFYPDTYANFDVNNIIYCDPAECKAQPGGYVAIKKYKFPGTEEAQNILIQLPTLQAPCGIIMWKDNTMSMLCNLPNWNDEVKQLIALLRRIEARDRQYLVEKNLFPPEAVTNYFRETIKNSQQYGDSISLKYNIAHSYIFDKDGKMIAPKLMPKNSFVTSIIMNKWLYMTPRVKNPTISNNWEIFQSKLNDDIIVNSECFI